MRGYLYPGDWDDRNVFPILTLKVLILEATQPGATGSGNDLLATLRFYDVDGVRLQDFNHNNSIVGLKLRQQGPRFYTNGEPLPPSLLVTVEQGFGLSASFSCARLEVVAAERPPSGHIGCPQSLAWVRAVLPERLPIEPGIAEASVTNRRHGYAVEVCATPRGVPTTSLVAYVPSVQLREPMEHRHKTDCP
jgi:hypothetical protein